ncbi:integrin beta-6-like [Hyposmocoma kahamanoa]|uniref:integrin beta-6-like n=1 Tax=Hyposmocoma kahamanoa TaxID=1477025 RepID=UPI000E6D9793|nr:integrin beta-6-like [Hyposmocoma kahamanoa]
MANMFHAVLVLLSFQYVYARDCDPDAIAYIRNCDECIRCGYKWCEQPQPFEQRCFKDGDKRCPGHTAELTYKPLKTVSTSKVIDPTNWIQYIAVGSGLALPMKLKFAPTINHEINIHITNSSVSEELYSNFELTSESIHCDIDWCYLSIGALPTQEFCPASGSEDEFITFNISIGEKGPMTVAEYHVPCACACSKNVDKNSSKCNNHGDFSCGSCACHDGWKGENCSRQEIPETMGYQKMSETLQIAERPVVKTCDRGDIPACTPVHSNEECSNNGFCDCSDTNNPRCHCDTSKEGYYYFDAYCTDICTTTNFHDSCLMTNDIGPCKDYSQIYTEVKNKTLLTETDVLGRKIWIECSLNNDGCVIQYAAMKEDHEIRVMILDHCGTNQDAVVGGKVNVTLPVVLGVIALVATAAAVAGYMMWKQRTPPLPGSDPQYTNIEAQDSTGVNPLYIPPTSSFKNPTYGKW